jgi:hypothetical protein
MLSIYNEAFKKAAAPDESGAAASNLFQLNLNYFLITIFLSTLPSLV